MPASRIRCSGLTLAVALTRCVLFSPSACEAFVVPSRLSSRASSRSSSAVQATQNGYDENNSVQGEYSSNISTRRSAVKSILGAVISGGILLSPLQPANADIEGVATPSLSDAPATKIESSSSDASTNNNGGGVTMYKTTSGLKYIEINEGTGPTPQYGQLVSISYQASIKLPDIQGQPQKLQEFDSDNAYLIKHGNGRTVPGLDEGIHTMKVGGKRRLIVPAKLGYVAGGLGPIPESPLGRYKLNKLLDKMVEVKGGNVVFDVALRNVLNDEADQGYYGDESISPEDFETLKNNVQQAGQEARAAQSTQV